MPEKEDFYSKFNDSPISHESYEHAKNVWRAFNCDTLSAYSDIYLKTDIMLLSDIFEISDQRV